MRTQCLRVSFRLRGVRTRFEEFEEVEYGSRGVQRRGGKEELIGSAELE